MSGADVHVHGPGHPAVAHLATNRRLTAGSHFQEVRHLELDLGPSGLTYEPGDALALLPQQPPDAIRTFLELCQLEASDVVTVGLVDRAQDASLQVCTSVACFWATYVRVQADKFRSRKP